MQKVTQFPCWHLFCTNYARTESYPIFNRLSIWYRHRHSILVDWRGGLLFLQFLPFLLPPLITSDDHGDDQETSDNADDNDDWNTFFTHIGFTGESVSTVMFFARAFVRSYSVSTHGIRRTVVRFLVAFVSVVTVGSTRGES